MRIGLVGCGRIANEAHADAYALSGVTVSAVCDLDAPRAGRMAERLQCAQAATALELAGRPDVDVIDVATPPTGRLKLLEELISVGKPILCQKPLAYTLHEATEIVRLARDASVPLAVNHNARWAPFHLKLYEFLASGVLGDVWMVSHHNRYNEDVDTWYTRHRDYLFLDHGLHYFDLIRVVTQRTPVAVSCLGGFMPGQRPRGPVGYVVQLRFADGPLTSMSFNNATPTPIGFDYRLVVDGTLASSSVDFGGVTVVPQDGAPSIRHETTGDWVPDGFAGSLRAFLNHLKNGGPLPHSGEDHLRSLAVAEAAAQSAAARGRWVDVEVADDLTSTERSADLWGPYLRG